MSLNQVSAAGLAAAALLSLSGCADPTAPSGAAGAPALNTLATAAPSFVQVSAGAYHTCGLTADHHAYCWGENALGALGNGDRGGTIRADEPVPVLTNLKFIAISAGVSNTCALSGQSLA